MENGTVVQSFARKSRVLAPLVWFSIAWGHFPSIHADLTNSSLGKLLLTLYCALFNILLLMELILSTYFSFYHTRTTTMSFVFLINHLCHVCASFVAPSLTLLGWKEWQSTILEEDEKNPLRQSQRKRIVTRAVLIGLALNFLLFTWIVFLVLMHGSIMAADRTGLAIVANILGFIFTTVQSFTHSVVPLQFFVCCWLVRDQLQHIGHCLERKIRHKSTNLDDVLEATRKSVFRISERVITTNTYFGMPLLLLLSAKIARTITNLYSIIRLVHRTSSSDRLLNSLYNIYYVSLDMSALVFILWGAESVSRQFTELRRVVAKISTLNMNQDGVGRLTCFMVQLNYVQVEMSAASFFVLGKRLCPSVVGATLTYIFVLMQFDLSDHKTNFEMRNCTY